MALETPDWVQICNILNEKGFFDDEQQELSLQTAFHQCCQEEQSMFLNNPCCKY